jgi:hypothetical protein
MIEYRTADGYQERLPALAADLVRQRPMAVVAPNGFSALAAKSATQDIPIIFLAGYDPVELGLVASLNRPAAISRASCFSVPRLLKSAFSCYTKLCRPLKRLLCWLVPPTV